MGDVAGSQAMINHSLLKAARDGDVEALETALKRGAFLETRRPFVITPESSSADTVGNGDAARGVGLTPLMHGAQGGHRKVVELLVSAKANVEAQEEDGLRPLHFAASADSREACLILLQAAADPGARDDEGRNALAHVPLHALATRVERQRWESLFGSKKDTCNNGGNARQDDSVAASFPKGEDTGRTASEGAMAL